MGSLFNAQQFRTIDPPAHAIGAALALGAPVFDDPLADDHDGDDLVITSFRRLQRLAIVAAKTGARFTREAITHDPVAWLLAPRAVFGGRAAIEACMERSHFERAILLHGLSLGLDAEPRDLDDLLDNDSDSDDDNDNDHEDEDGRITARLRNEAIATGRASGEEGAASAGGGEGAAGGSRRLFTATIVDEAAPGTLQAFHASLGRSEEEFLNRLRAQVGGRTAALAKVRAGFDAVNPLVAAMVSDAMADMLQLIELDPQSPLAEGLDVRIEQRFAA